MKYLEKSLQVLKYDKKLTMLKHYIYVVNQINTKEVMLERSTATEKNIMKKIKLIKVFSVPSLSEVT